MRPLPVALLLGFLIAVAAGCGGGANAPLSPPSYDPDEMAQAAVQQLDKNGNGSVEGGELDACPGLKAAFPAIDTNNDKKLSNEELKVRFLSYRAAGAGAVGFVVRVSLDGQPLTDADIKLSPEPFMGKTVSEATGRTGPDGTVSNYTVDGKPLPGLPPGVYRVAVTKDGVSIPARFNTQTTLGCEVTGGGRGGSAGYEAKLTGR